MSAYDDRPWLTLYQNQPAGSSTGSATPWPPVCSRTASPAVTVWPSTCRTCRSSIAMVAAWKAGGIMVSINPMSRERELSYLLRDSGATALVALESQYDQVCRHVVPDTDVRLVLTTSELEFQTRSDERLFAGITRQRIDGTTDLAELLARHDGEVPPPATHGPDDVAFLHRRPQEGHDQRLRVQGLAP